MSRSKIDVYTDLHRSPEKLKEVSGALGLMQKSAHSSGIKLSGLWKQVAIGMGVTLGVPALIKGAKGLAGSFLDVASKTEQYEFRLRKLLGSQKAASDAMAFFEKVAAKVPFTLEEVIEAGTTVTAFGADLQKWTPVLTDLSAVMGVDLVESASALGRAYAGGVGAADVFRERGILQIIKDFAKMKKGIDDITKLSLPEFREVMYAALTDVEGKVAGAGEELSTTWTGIISMLEDKWFKFRKAVMESGVFQLLKEGLIDFNEKLDEFIAEGKLEEWARKTALAVLTCFQWIIEGIQNAVSAFYGVRYAIAEIEKQYLSFIASYDVAKQSVAFAMGLFDRWRDLVVENADALKDLNERQEKLSKDQDDFVEQISKTQSAFSTLIEKIQKYKFEVEDTKNKQKEFSSTVGETAQEVYQALPPMQDLTDIALQHIPLYDQLAFYNSEYGKKLLEAAHSTQELTDKQRENLAMMQEWSGAVQAGIPGVVSFLKALVIREILMSFAKSPMPFFVKLAALIPITLALSAFTKAIDQMLAPKGGGFQKGAYFKQRTVIAGEIAEKEEEFIAPKSMLKATVKESLREMRGFEPALAYTGSEPASKVELHFHAPLVSTTGLTRGDVDRAAEMILRKVEFELLRKGAILK